MHESKRPPGWYESPEGTRRWWDGKHWATGDGAAPESQPLQRAAAASSPAPATSGPQLSATSSVGTPASAVTNSAAAPPHSGVLAHPLLRLLARWVDALVTGTLTVLIARSQADAVNEVLSTYATKPAGLSPDWAEQAMRTPGFLSSYLQLLGVFIGVTAVYFIVATALWGATLGKLACGIRVQRAGQAAKPSLLASAVRWITTDVLLISTLSIGVSAAPWAMVLELISLAAYLYWVVDRTFCLTNPQRQCLHDKFARTVVVRASGAKR